MNRDREMTQLQETGQCTIVGHITLAELSHIAYYLGFEPSEISVGYDKGALYLMASTSGLQEDAPWCTCGAKTSQGQYHKYDCPAYLKYVAGGNIVEDCGRFFATRYPADYLFCYKPKGHERPCDFEKRRR